MIGKTSDNKLIQYQYFWLILLFISLLYSGTLLIISMIMLVLPSIISFEWKPFSIKFFPDFRRRMSDFTNEPSYFLITLIFWISCLSILNSADKETWLFFTNMKLPFLLLPFAFFNLPALSRKGYFSLFFIFVFILFGSSFEVIIQFFERPEQLRAIISQGQSIPTPVDHIKYSLFLSFGIIAGLIVLTSKIKVFFKGEKIILGILVLYLFIFIHLIAVRSGILILYVNLIVFIFATLWSKKQYLLGLALVLTILAIPFIAYKTIPTFKAKVNYSIRDYQMSSINKEMDFSDGERLRSYSIGWELFESSPIVGVGVGDVFKEYADLYEIRYFDKSPTYLPHNQFLTVAVFAGVIGLLFFMVSFFFPFLHRELWQDPLMRALFILMLLSFMVENTLERQYSVGFYLVFLLLGLNQLFKNKRDKSPNFTQNEAQ